MTQGARWMGAIAVILAAMASACHRASKSGGEGLALVDTVRATPSIDSVRPDSAVMSRGAVVEMTVRGHGFMRGKPGMNTVHLGSVTLGKVPANDAGTELRFVIPDAVATGEAPPLPLGFKP